MTHLVESTGAAIKSKPGDWAGVIERAAADLKARADIGDIQNPDIRISHGLADIADRTEGDPALT